MKITCISDVHGRLNEKDFKSLPHGDVLIIAGDLFKEYSDCNRERASILQFRELEKFNNLCPSLPFKHILVVAGNHDYVFDEGLHIEIDLNFYYLENKRIIIDGVHFYGIPYMPKWRLGKDVFVRERGGASLKWLIDLIPKETNVLITHGPPYKILDKNNKSGHVGCKVLLKKIKKLKKIKLHVFGHVHDRSGVQKINGVAFVNASLINQKGKVVNRPKRVNYRRKKHVKENNCISR